MGTTLTVQQLAEAQGLSPTYLSKILTKLVKAGMIASIPGVHGGYRLVRSKESLSFLAVIHAIEGTASFFQEGGALHHEACLVEQVMMNAEHHMETYLTERKLVELADQMSTFLETHRPLSARGERDA